MDSLTNLMTDNRCDLYAALFCKGYTLREAHNFFIVVSDFIERSVTPDKKSDTASGWLTGDAGLFNSDDLARISTAAHLDRHRLMTGLQCMTEIFKCRAARQTVILCH